MNLRSWLGRAVSGVRDVQTDFNRAVYRWRSCPELRQAFLEFARNEVEHQRKFGVQELAERLRWREFVGRDGDGFKLDNSLLPAYARLLVRDYPACRPFITLRKSRFDALMGGAAGER